MKNLLSSVIATLGVAGLAIVFVLLASAATEGQPAMASPTSDYYMRKSR